MNPSNSNGDVELMKQLEEIVGTGLQQSRSLFKQGLRPASVKRYNDIFQQLAKLIQTERTQAAAEARQKHEGIGAYLAVSMLLQNVAYLLAHKAQGLPEMTSEVIGSLYEQIKKTMADNEKYMRSPVASSNPEQEKS